MRHYGARVTLVVLTGMGDDGLVGARAVVLVEAESTCVVYGMPRSVQEAGLASAVIPLDTMPLAIAGAVAPRAGAAARWSPVPAGGTR